MSPQRAITGLEAAAEALAACCEHVAVVGGDGARRLAEALCALPDGASRCLPSRGAEALTAALGMRLAGARVAVVASGRAAMLEVVRALREAESLGATLLVVVPSHGDERGREVAGEAFDDVALALGEPVGVMLAGDAGEVGAAVREAASRRDGTSWCVAFELARVGCGLDVARDAAWSAVRGAARGGDVTVAPGAGRFEEALSLGALQPLPAEALAAAVAGARVAAREPWPSRFGAGRLASRLGLALGAPVSETSASRARPHLAIDLAWPEPARRAVVRALLEALSHAGLDAVAEAHEPWFATVRVAGVGEGRAVVAHPDALGLASVLGALPAGASVLLLGPCDGARLGALRAACEAAGCALSHEPEATLAP